MFALEEGVPIHESSRGVLQMDIQLTPLHRVYLSFIVFILAILIKRHDTCRVLINGCQQDDDCTADSFLANAGACFFGHRNYYDGYFLVLLAFTRPCAYRCGLAPCCCTVLFGHGIAFSGDYSIQGTQING